MSLWYSCRFASIGTDAEIQNLHAACSSYWHHSQAEKGSSPGFIQVQASRNHGAHDAIEKMVADFAHLIFVGSVYTDQDFGNDCIEKGGDIDSCHWWHFHGFQGLVKWHEMPDSPEVEVEPPGPESATGRVMSEEERVRFQEARRQAGLMIDPNSAEVDWWYIQIMDPYGIDPELPEELQCVGRGYFARSLDGDVWVSLYDLPEATRDALWEKHKHQLAFPAGLPPMNCRAEGACDRDFGEGAS